MLLHLISYLLYFYNIIVSIYFILITLIQFHVFSSDNEIILEFIKILGRVVEPVVKYIRKIVPKIRNIDLPLILLIIIIEILRNICMGEN